MVDGVDHAGRLGRGPQHVGPGAGPLRRAEDGGYLVAAGQERLEDRLAKVPLADDRDPNITTSEGFLTVILREPKDRP
jgi:hypothetical protein